MWNETRPYGVIVEVPVGDLISADSDGIAVSFKWQAHRPQVRQDGGRLGIRGLQITEEILCKSNPPGLGIKTIAVGPELTYIVQQLSEKPDGAGSHDQILSIFDHVRAARRFAAARTSGW
jgi:hypothetical protein